MVCLEKIAAGHLQSSLMKMLDLLTVDREISSCIVYSGPSYFLCDVSIVAVCRCDVITVAICRCDVSSVAVCGCDVSAVTVC